MTSVLTRMRTGELRCHKIGEDREHFAVLEPKPLTPGHSLVFPKVETDGVLDLEDASLSGLMLFAKRIARILKAEIDCPKIALVTYGLKVRHAHVHLIPVYGMPGETDLSKERVEASDADLSQMAGRLWTAFQKLPA